MPGGRGGCRDPRGVVRFVSLLFQGFLLGRCSWRVLRARGVVRCLTRVAPHRRRCWEAPPGAGPPSAGRVGIAVGARRGERYHRRWNTRTR